MKKALKVFILSTAQGIPYKFSPKMDAIYMADEKDKVYFKVPD